MKHERATLVSNAILTNKGRVPCVILLLLFERCHSLDMPMGGASVEVEPDFRLYSQSGAIFGEIE